jgi:hypothetical protein
MLGLAPLALRVWASSNGRPLHSRAFHSERQDFATPRPGLRVPVARDCQVSIPLFKTTPRNSQTGTPLGGAPLANFKSRRSSPLFGLTADPRPTFPTRAVRPNAPLHSRLLKFLSERRRYAHSVSQRPRYPAHFRCFQILFSSVLSLSPYTSLLAHRGPDVATFRGILPLAALCRRLFS